MKTIFRKFFTIGLVSAMSLFVFSGCDNNDDNNNSTMFTVSGAANGSQVVPSVSGTATGNITGTYNAQTNQMVYNMTWAGLSGTATSAGFYNGSVGTNGSLFSDATITTSGSTGASAGTITLTDAQE